MKSRKVKAYQAHKKFKADLTLEESDSDANPDSFFHDEIDDFNNEKDDLMSTDDELIYRKDGSSDEEEVLPITDDEKEETGGEGLDKDESEEEDDDDDDEQNLPNREAWGKKKSTYYSADFVDEDRGRTYREKDAEAARAEGEEANVIDKNVQGVDHADTISVFFMEDSKVSSKIEADDLKSSTREDDMKYLKTETQMLQICNEFKSAIHELKRFSRLLHLVETKKIRSKNLENYIRTKNGVLSLYCLNLSMYMMLKSSGKNPKYHPVMQRISSFKGLLEELKSTDSIAAPAIDNILEKESQGEEIEFCSESEKEDNLDESIAQSLPKDSTEITKESRIKKAKTKHMETENERLVMSLISEVKEEVKKRKHEKSDEDNEEILEDESKADLDENNAGEKRIITYEIAKNKGLVPHRKKEYRNPRVRNRQKYRKANIRRKGQVRGVVKEIKRYEGEPTGINTNVIKSVKFK